VAVLRTAIGREVDKGDDRWGLGVSEREGEGRGAGEPGQALGCGCCYASWAGPRGERRRGGGVERAAAGRKGRGGENEPVGLLSISISFFFFPAFLCIV
jgi:hypothetical protein